MTRVGPGVAIAGFVIATGMSMAFCLLEFAPLRNFARNTIHVPSRPTLRSRVTERTPSTLKATQTLRLCAYHPETT